jgi:hypothetical protein
MDGGGKTFGGSAMLRRSTKERSAMLEEWIRNLPTDLLNKIATDAKAEGSRIWQLAVVELMVRQNHAVLAA